MQSYVVFCPTDSVQPQPVPNLSGSTPLCFDFFVSSGSGMGGFMSPCGMVVVLNQKSPRRRGLSLNQRQDDRHKPQETEFQFADFFEAFRDLFFGYFPPHRIKKSPAVSQRSRSASEACPPHPKSRVLPTDDGRFRSRTGTASGFWRLLFLGGGRGLMHEPFIYLAKTR